MELHILANINAHRTGPEFIRVLGPVGDFMEVTLFKAVHESGLERRRQTLQDRMGTDKDRCKVMQ